MEQTPPRVIVMLMSIGDLLGLGLEPKDLGAVQVCLRGLIVFIATLIIVRLAHKRFLARLTAFDVVLGFILGSALARAVNGSAPFFPTLLMGLLLVMLHRAISALAFHSQWFGRMVKGNEARLVENGQVLDGALRRHKVSEKDLMEEARLKGRVTQLQEIQIATLERNGDVSVIPRKE